MKRGFYTIMSAQFFSSLADNALFVAAVELLRLRCPEWQRAALVPMFALFYVILAPLSAPLPTPCPRARSCSSAMPSRCRLPDDAVRPPPAAGLCRGRPGRGRLFAGQVRHPDRAAAALQLVKANGWIEGLTITSIILGVLLGGQLVGPAVAAHLLAWTCRLSTRGRGRHRRADVCLRAGGRLQPAHSAHRHPAGAHAPPGACWPHAGPAARLLDCNRRLWRDKLGQISLSTTTLFWGVSGNLRYIVLAWAAAALGYSTTQASALVGVVAIGTAAGAVLASMRMRLEHATR
jgi:hypothetical protein